MLTRARAAWAGLTFSGLRAATGRAAEFGPWAARRGVEGRDLGPDCIRIDGPLSVNPMSGAIFVDGRRLDLGAEERPTDWLVQAFPSKLHLGLVCPLWYGPRADERALLQEALPRAIALARAAPDAEALVSLPLGKLPVVQEAIAAGAFGELPVRVHAWDKVIVAEAAVTRPAPSDEDMAEAAQRLADCG